MKKQLKRIFCSVICLAMLVTGINAFAEPAETSPMQLKWYGDYSSNTEPELVVEFTTPAQYKQQITAVVYPKSLTNPTSADYVQILETTVSNGKTEELIFAILDTYRATDGKYVVKLRGNGHMSSASADEVAVDIIKPSAIPGLLNEFKQALTVDAFATALAKVSPALQLEEESDAARKTKRINIMLSMRANDYAGEFGNLENVRDSWNLSDVISYISDADRTTEGIKSRIEANSVLLGIDTTTDNYKDYIDTVCEDIKNYASEYNNGAGVLSAKDVQGIVNQYIGLHLVNEATDETLYNTFEEYKEYFQLPAEELSKYNSWGQSDRDKALRSVYRPEGTADFVKNSELADAFKTGVNNVINNAGTTTTPQTPTIIVTPQGGSPSNSMSGGMPPAPTTPSTPTVPEFKDVPSSHWAYEYVTKLSAKGIINGYDDGTFKPSANVTREEFVKMIVSATGLKKEGAVCSFTDVPADAWYYDFVASGYVNGIIDGISDTTFGVGSNITRQDVAVIAARVFSSLGKVIPEVGETTLTDLRSVSDYARESVKLLNGMGVISGFDDGSFKPKNALTRAEAAAIISRLTANL